MNTNITYKIDHNNGIIFELLQGDIGINEMIEYFIDKFNDPDYNDSYKVLFDIRDSEILIKTEDEVQMLSNFIKEASLTHNFTHTIAFLTSNPTHVVFSELLKIKVTEYLKIRFEIFSTYKVACDFLGIGCQNWGKR